MSNKKFEEFLIKYFKNKGVKDILKRKNENLIQSGVMDSLDIVTLVFEIKKNFNIKIDITNNKTLNEFSSFKGLINIKKNNK
jgi:acyl carrier protein